VVLRLETSLLVRGPGPATVVAAKVAGACGQPCLLVGHEITGDDEAVVLDVAGLDALEQYGLVDVLRPHLVAAHPPSIVPSEFEYVLRQHCIADLNVSVYDRFDVVDRVVRDGTLHGVLTDGTSRWELVADTWIDAATLATSLPAAIHDGALAARHAIDVLTRKDRTGP